jgi:uncharacterized protein YdeI (YjbR/CyaY-like superfamily)
LNRENTMPTTDPRVDAYIDNAAAFARPILAHLRAAVHSGCPQVVETIKWGMPFFVHEGKNLAFMAAFKAHAGFGFWRGREVVGAGKESEAMGQFGRLTKASDLPGKRELARLVKDAAILAATRLPKTRKAGPRPALELPDDLARALARNAGAQATFDAFAPSHRRDYIEWITEARREETRGRRVLQAIEWLAEGKTRHWKHRPA